MYTRLFDVLFSVSQSVIAYRLFHTVLTKCRASHISKPLIKIRFDSLAAKLSTKRMALWLTCSSSVSIVGPDEIAFQFLSLNSREFALDILKF